jgi:ribosomal protein L37AE/L43A
MSDRIYCRICCGERPMSKDMCLGCGTPRANAAVPKSNKPANTQPKPKCPGCGLDHSTMLEAGRWQCAVCHAVFEGVEFTFLDDRAEQNAIKRERQKQR